MSRKYEVNKYKIINDFAIIYLDKKDGTSMECKIDLEDLDKVLNFSNKWYSSYRKKIDGYYACANYYVEDKNNNLKHKTMYLHRMILNISDRNIRIDHIDYNTLNNTKSNLRVSNAETNSTNRSRINKNNKLGYRNICEVGGKLIIQLQVDGKNKVLGKFEFEELDMAVSFAEEMRSKYYGEFAGK